MKDLCSVIKDGFIKKHYTSRNGKHHNLHENRADRITNCELKLQLNKECECKNNFEEIVYNIDTQILKMKIKKKFFF